MADLLDIGHNLAVEGGDRGAHPVALLGVTAELIGMTKARVLGGNATPHVPTATRANRRIPCGGLILRTDRRVFHAAAVGDKDQVILSEIDVRDLARMRHGDATRDLLGVRAVGVARKGGLLDSLDRVLAGASDGAARTLAATYLEHHVFDLGVKVELHTVRLEIALHGQDHRLVLVIAGEAQGAKVGQTRDVMDVAADIELHLERRVPVLKGEHGAPVHPEVRVEHLVVKEIGDGTIRQLLVGRKEQVHDLGCRLVRQAELAISTAVLTAVLGRAAQRVVGVLLVEPVILVEYGDVRIFN